IVRDGPEHHGPGGGRAMRIPTAVRRVLRPVRPLVHAFATVLLRRWWHLEDRWVARRRAAATHPGGVTYTTIKGRVVLARSTTSRSPDEHREHLLRDMVERLSTADITHVVLREPGLGRPLVAVAEPDRTAVV